MIGMRFIVSLFVSAMVSQAGASESYGNSCVMEVGQQVYNYFGIAMDSELAPKVVSLSPVYAGANPAGEWIEVYTVLLKINGLDKSYSAKLDSSCQLISLQPVNTVSFFSGSSSLQLNICESYEPGCDRRDDGPDSPDSPDSF